MSHTINLKKSEKKVTGWRICTITMNSYRETRRSSYHGIDEKHVQALVKFEGRLSIHSERKKETENVFHRLGSILFL
jgi:hypothetical protein